MGTETINAVQIVGILQRGPATETVRRVLEDEGMSVNVRDSELSDNMWRDARSADAILVDDSLDPGHIREALERGWIHGTAPVFVVAQRLPGRDRYVEWLEAGAWDVVKVPLECTPLALRLRNILDTDRPEKRPPKVRRYSLQTLEKVADEALALAHRYDRPLYCVALAVDWPETGSDTHPVVERLADVAQGMVRRSDLLGLGDERTLLVLLPDTDEEGTGVFMARLVATLEERLKEWGVIATLRAEKVAAHESESGRELLSMAVRRLGK